MKTINDDQPIKSKDKDLLNRNGYAERVASFLMTAPAKNGLVVSINGKWGSGKTSFLNLVKRKIEEDRSKRASRAWTDGYPVIVDFAPWCALDEESAVRQFFDALIRSLPIKKKAKIAKNIACVAKLVGAIAPDKVVKAALGALAEGLQAYSDSLLGKGKGLMESRAAIVKELDKGLVRYIVFIDDLDRLNDGEIRLVTQLVKAVCNFPNTIYVLAFDRDIVASSLTNQQATVDGGEYLKKIVQMEFNIPVIKQSLLSEITKRELFDAISLYAPLPKDKEELDDAIGDGLLSGFQTIRDEKLFLNRVQSELDSFAGEIALADLVGIAYLRFLNPGIIGIVLEYQDILLGRISRFAEQEKVSKRKDELREKLKKLPSIEYAKHQRLYERLFPNIERIAFDKQAKSIEGRIYSFAIFHKYLQMDYEDGDLSLRALRECFADPTVESLNSFGSKLSGLEINTFFKGLVELCETSEKDPRLGVLVEFLLEGAKADGPFNRAKGEGLHWVVGALASGIGLERTKALISGAIGDANNIDSLVNLLIMSKYEKIKDVFDEALVGRIRAKAGILAQEAYERVDDPINVSVSVLQYVLSKSLNDLRELLAQKDDEWKRRLIASLAGQVGSSYSTKMSVLYGPRVADLKKVVQNLGVDLPSFIETEENPSVKQRLLLVGLLVGKETLSDEIRISDIKKYCEEKDIPFEPSDNYEFGL